MTQVTAAVEVAAPVGAVWDRLTDWPAHGRWIAFTQVRRLPGPEGGVGSRFVGRTGLGPVGFDDPMEVVEWRPPAGGGPGRCAVRKLGRVVLGSAVFEVGPAADGRTAVRWIEDIEVAPVRLTRPFGRLVGAVGGVLFTRTLRAMARELEAEGR
jgi:hypothetical protein